MTRYVVTFKDGPAVDLAAESVDDAYRRANRLEQRRPVDAVTREAWDRARSAELLRDLAAMGAYIIREPWHASAR